MSSSWARAAAAKPASSETLPSQNRTSNLVLRLGDAARHVTRADLAALAARWATHLAIGALLIVALWVFGASELPLPDAERALPEQGPATGSRAIPETPSSVAQRRYLTLSAVPYTVRVLRDSLPMGEPKQRARTSVLEYEVREGETLLVIAARFGLKGSTLIWANDKLADNPDFLHIGQKLNILPVDGAYHTVAAGETVESIAKQYKVDPVAITGYAGNGLGASQALQVGQKLIIPGGTKPYVARNVFSFSGQVPTASKKGTGSFAWPMSGSISQGYWQGHRAIDIAAPLGTSVVASDAGYVAVTQWHNQGYGRMVIIDHGNGYQTLYAHLNSYSVEAGQSVARGQVIGHCGRTGNATGPHLHFEVIKGGARLNPLSFLP